jgi:hypothetical protein
LTTHPAHNINVTIGRPAADVYDFLSKPENFPLWASGLATSIEPEGDHWVTDTPDGRVVIRFSPVNDLGVVDHRVTMPSGVEVFVPMRVVSMGKEARSSSPCSKPRECLKPCSNAILAWSRGTWPR